MMLPNGWKKVKIKDIESVDIQNGYSPLCVDYETNRKTLSLGALTGFSLDVSQQKNISENAVMPIHSLLKRNDILVSRSNTKDKVGRAAVVFDDLKGIYYPDLMMRFQVNEKIADCQFVVLCLQSPAGRRYFESCAAGTSTSMVKINKNVLESFPIMLPPLEEQKKIAATLSVWDSAIEKMEKLIEAKEDQKKSLIWKLIESNDNRKIKLGKVVVDKNKWRKSKLSDVASGFDYGMNAAAKEYDGKNKYIRITDIDDVSHKFNSIDLVSPNAELEDKYRVNEGDILFARTGASTGKSYLYDKNDGILYFAGFLIRVHVLKDNPFFIYIQTLSSKYQNWLKKMSMRSGQPGVNAEEYKNLPVLVPTLPEQNAITEVLSAAEKELSLLKQQLENYKKQKQGLMQKLLTGEWRVK